MLLHATCASFHPKSRRSCEFLTSTVSSDSPKLSNARLKRLDDSVRATTEGARRPSSREATAIRCLKRLRVQDC